MQAGPLTEGPRAGAMPTQGPIHTPTTGAILMEELIPMQAGPLLEGPREGAMPTQGPIHTPTTGAILMELIPMQADPLLEGTREGAIPTQGPIHTPTKRAILMEELIPMQAGPLTEGPRERAIPTQGPIHTPTKRAILMEELTEGAMQVTTLAHIQHPTVAPTREGATEVIPQGHTQDLTPEGPMREGTRFQAPRARHLLRVLSREIHVELAKVTAVDITIVTVASEDINVLTTTVAAIMVSAVSNTLYVFCCFYKPGPVFQSMIWLIVD